MEEFLRQNYHHLTHGVELIAAVTGFLLYKKYKNTNAKYFIWFLIYLVLADFLGRYVYYIKDDGFLSFLEGTVLEKNRWLSTLRWKIGGILFYSFYFETLLEKRHYKKILKYTRYAFFIFSIGYILWNWNDFFIKSFPVISVLGAIIIFLCTTLYFIEILQGENLLKFYKSINFYISSTILIWWLIITPLVFYDIYFTNADWNFVILKWQIYLFANIFMYLTFAFALIFCQPDINSGNKND